MKKAQSSIEFVILVGVVMFFALVFLFAIQSNLRAEREERINLELTEIGNSLQTELRLAFEASEGYHRNFTLPENIAGIDYEISLDGGVLYIKTVDEKYTGAFSTFKNVIGQPQKGNNQIIKQDNQISLN